MVELTLARVRKMRPPEPPRDADKNSRGTVLVIGGSAQMPGAILLAGTAALRAGAGKLQLATSRSVAPALGVAMPEALVIALEETPSGEIDGGRCSAALSAHVKRADAILLGPGMLSRRSAQAILEEILREAGAETKIVLDAEAIAVLKSTPETGSLLGERLIITPHCGEMATLLGVDADKVEADFEATASNAAQEFNSVVVLKGAGSIIADPAGSAFRYGAGNAGLATSGSGDVLAGIIAGLAACGGDPMSAACCGVFMHGEAGSILSRRIGRVGFLARELLAEIPGVLSKLAH